MTKQEGEPQPFNFPQEINGVLLGLAERARRTGSLRVAVAHQIEEDGLFLREVAEKFFPQDAERKIAVNEYTRLGTLILETADALRSGNYEGKNFQRSAAILPPSELGRFLQEKQQVELLKEDPTGFSLLTWWTNRGVKEFENFPLGERQAAIIGRLNGLGRYKKLYNALVVEGVPKDT